MEKIAIIGSAIITSIIVGTLAAVAVFKSSTPAESVENKQENWWENMTWQLTQTYTGTDDNTFWITIENVHEDIAIWAIAWEIIPEENPFGEGPWHYFTAYVYSSDGEIVSMSSSFDENTLTYYEMVPALAGQFRVKIFTGFVENWWVYIYEYR